MRPYQIVEKGWRYVHSLRHITGIGRTEGQTDGRTDGRAITIRALHALHAGAELVMGHFFKTQPIIDTWYDILGYIENFIQQLLHVTDKFTVYSTSQLSMKVIIQLQYSLTDSRVFRDVKNIT